MKAFSHFASLFFLALGLIAAASVPSEADVKPVGMTKAGTLSVVAGQDPVLKSDGKAYRLSSADPDIAATLKDPHMNNRPVELQGQLKGADGFEVQHLFVVRAGKRYRVIYYCDVCNLYDVKPGDCVCCQAPLQLIEVPLDDPRGAGK